MINYILKLFGKPRRLTKSELIEIQELNRIAGAEAFKAQHFALNTSQLTVDKGTRGATLASQQKLVAQLCQQLKDQHVSRKLAELGYAHEQRVAIDMVTGSIKLIK